MLSHLQKVDVLNSAEATKIKEAGRLQDQIKMLTSVVSGKDAQGSDAIQEFMKRSDSQVAQLILNHGKWDFIRFSLF